MTDKKEDSKKNSARQDFNQQTTEKESGLETKSVFAIDFYDLCQTILSSSGVDVLFLGDSNHSDNDVSHHLYDPYLIERLGKVGLDMVMLESDNLRVINTLKEMSTYDESLLTGVFNNFAKKLTLSQKLEIFAGLAHKRGIRVEGVDPQTEEAKRENQLQSEGSLLKTMKSMEQRLDLDFLLNEHIAYLSKEFNKGLLIYGAAHGSKLGDGLLEDPRFNMIKVTVCEDAATYGNILQRYESYNSWLVEGASKVGEDPPHFVYLLEDRLAIQMREVDDNFLLSFMKNHEVLMHKDSTLIMPDSTLRR